MGRKKSEMWKCIGEHEFDGDIVITDPCYIGHKMNWDDMNDFMGSRGLISQTFYGDWGCTVFRTDAQVGSVPDDAEKLGRFTADAGMVCVLDMADILDMDPDFQKFIDEHVWCVTVLKGFRGTIRLMTRTLTGFLETKSEGRMKYEDTELRVRGDGEKDGERFSFESVQTSA